MSTEIPPLTTNTPPTATQFRRQDPTVISIPSATVVMSTILSQDSITCSPVITTPRSAGSSIRMTPLFLAQTGILLVLIYLLIVEAIQFPEKILAGIYGIIS